MLRRRNLLVGATLAVLAGALSMGYSVHTERLLAAREASETVVVVGEKVPAHQRLKRPMLRLARVPRDSVLPGAYRSLNEAVGRVTTMLLWRGDQVIAARTAGAGEPEGLVAGLAAGERGFAVPVEAESARAVRPGDSVDVVAVMPSSDGLSQVSRLVPGVRVMKVGERGGTPGGLEPWVMLAVSPAQAQMLAVAAETGRLRLVLRGETDQRSLGGASVSGPSGVAERSPAKPSVRPVEVIRGVEREAQGH